MLKRFYCRNDTKMSFNLIGIISHDWQYLIVKHLCSCQVVSIKWKWVWVCSWRSKFKGHIFLDSYCHNNVTYSVVFWNLHIWRRRTHCWGRRKKTDILIKDTDICLLEYVCCSPRSTIIEPTQLQETFISGSTVETALSESGFITLPSPLSQKTVYKEVEFGKPVQFIEMLRSTRNKQSQ